MYSVSRTVGLSTTFRSDISIMSNVGEPKYACEIKSAVVSKGWETHTAKASQLFLDADTANYDYPLLLIRNPQLVFASETAALTQASTPPGSGTTIITSPELEISRLDSVDVDGLVTLEFRVTEQALAEASGDTTTDFNRVYLTANSAVVDYNAAPYLSTSGATEPGVLHENVGAIGTFDIATDLYLLVADAGALVTDGTDEVWFDRTSILTDPVWNADVVLAACAMRNVAADEVELDICRGSSTALVSATFRIVM